METTRLWEHIDAGRAAVADLLESLTPEQWATPSLCDAWTVRDVGAHLAIAPETTAGDALVAFVRSGFRFDRMVRDLTLARSAARSDEQIVADLRAVVGSRRLAPGTTPLEALLDVLVHTQDIVRPLGIEVAMPAEASAAAAERAWRIRFPFFPARCARGFRLVATDTDWSRGSGVDLHAPAGELLLVTTGRLDPRDALMTDNTSD